MTAILRIWLRSFFSDNDCQFTDMHRLMWLRSPTGCGYLYCICGWRTQWLWRECSIGRAMLSVIPPLSLLCPSAISQLLMSILPSLCHTRTYLCNGDTVG